MSNVNDDGTVCIGHLSRGGRILGDTSFFALIDDYMQPNESVITETEPVPPSTYMKKSFNEKRTKKNWDKKGY